MMKALPPQSRLRELLDYDGETGMFRWKDNSNWRRNSGWFVGAHDQEGYAKLRVDQKIYLAHRLAWAWMFGDETFGELDHINGKRDDNRLSNLRAVSRQENGRNRH